MIQLERVRLLVGICNFRSKNSTQTEFLFQSVILLMSELG
jgi:hypothetical protein